MPHAAWALPAWQGPHSRRGALGRHKWVPVGASGASQDGGLVGPPGRAGGLFERCKVKLMPCLIVWPPTASPCIGRDRYSFLSLVSFASRTLWCPFAHVGRSRAVWQPYSNYSVLSLRPCLHFSTPAWRPCLHRRSFHDPCFWRRSLWPITYNFAPRSSPVSSLLLRLITSDRLLVVSEIFISHRLICSRFRSQHAFDDRTYGHDISTPQIVEFLLCSVCQW
jgi:hypothetical protein